METIALVDTGPQVFILMEGFCLAFRQTILPVGGLLCLKGRGVVSIPYKKYIEANLIIPGLPQYNEDVLFLVVSDHQYGEQVPVQLGILVIDPLSSAYDH